MFKLILIAVIATNLTGCVSFEKTDIFNRETIPYLSVATCINLRILVIHENFLGEPSEPKEIGELGRMEITQTLSKLNVKTSCNAPIGTYTVIMHPKMSGAKVSMLTMWTIVTVLSAGLVPFVSPQEIDFTLLKGNDLVQTSELSHTKAIWIGFAYKYVSDDIKSASMYDVNSRSAGRNRLIADMLIGQIKKDLAQIK